MRIAIGSDHGGFLLKAEIKKLLTEMDIDVEDVGAHSAAPVDYPDFAAKVAAEVTGGGCAFGIVICGTGVGISIAANKIRGVRAALCGDPYSARMAREHNDANVLALGERVVGVGLARAIVEAWLEADFAGGRHARRVQKMMDLEQS